MTKSENDLLALVPKVSLNVGLMTLGAAGGGPPLRYLWIPLLPVIVFAVVLWLI